MPLIEYTVGSESHSSFWGKFIVKGLEKWGVKENEERDKHKSYISLAAEVSPGTIFTVFSQAGNKRGTRDYDFYICEVVEEGTEKITGGCYGTGAQAFGPFAILCHGAGTTKAPRLMAWWGKIGEKCAAFRTKEGKLQKGTKKLYAAWCKKHLDVKGLKDLPPITEGEPTC